MYKMDEELKKYIKTKEEETVKEFKKKFAPFKRETINLLLLDIKKKGGVTIEFAEAHIESLMGSGEDYPSTLIEKLIKAELVEENSGILFLTPKGQIVASLFERKLKRQLKRELTS